MAVRPDVGGDAASRPALHWDAVFTPSDLGTGVFDVRWDLRPRLRRWVAAHDLPYRWSREAHRPAVDAWAMLDGGVVAVSAPARPRHPGPVPERPGPAPLGPGIRVIGFRTLRLLASRLVPPGPGAAMPGERPDPPGVVEELFARRRLDAAIIEQAELLATGSDRSSLRWVVAALRG